MVQYFDPYGCWQRTLFSIRMCADIQRNGFLIRPFDMKLSDFISGLRTQQQQTTMKNKWVQNERRSQNYVISFGFLLLLVGSKTNKLNCRK